MTYYNNDFSQTQYVRDENGLHFNPVSLKYENSSQKANLKRQAEDQQLRQIGRAQTLNNRGQRNYDVLTGEQREGIDRIEPNNQQQRAALRDKDIIEKTRINQRAGNITKNLDVKLLIYQPPVQSTLHLPDNERFNKDFAAADKRKREQDIIYRERVQENHRFDAIQREQTKWEQLERNEQREKMKLQNHTIQLTNGKRNTNGLAFNPITLEYQKSEQGAQLQKQDDNSKVRQYVRAQNLDMKGNCSYNLLTGEQRPAVDNIVPNHLKTHYATKLKQKEEFYNMKHDIIQQQVINTTNQFYNNK